MKNYLITFLAIISIATYSCSDESSLPHIVPSANGSFTDERDGNVYEWVRIGDLEWMTTNLKYGVPYYEKEYGGVFANTSGNPQGVITYEPVYDFESDFQKYGNLYTWEEANVAAPEGWRLPTDEDWQQLEETLGMSADVAQSIGWRGKSVADLLRQGEEGTGLNFQLSGCAKLGGSFGINLYLSYVNEFGYFWTASKDENSSSAVENLFYRKIFNSYSSVYRGTVTSNFLMRIRCVRDANQ